MTIAVAGPIQTGQTLVGCPSAPTARSAGLGWYHTRVGDPPRARRATPAWSSSVMPLLTSPEPKPRASTGAWSADRATSAMPAPWANPLSGGVAGSAFGSGSGKHRLTDPVPRVGSSTKRISAPLTRSEVRATGLSHRAVSRSVPPGS